MLGSISNYVRSLVALHCVSDPYRFRPRISHLVHELSDRLHPTNILGTFWGQQRKPTSVEECLKQSEGSFLRGP